MKPILFLKHGWKVIKIFSNWQAVDNIILLKQRLLLVSLSYTLANILWFGVTWVNYRFYYYYYYLYSSRSCSFIPILHSIPRACGKRCVLLVTLAPCAGRSECWSAPWIGTQPRFHFHGSCISVRRSLRPSGSKTTFGVLCSLKRPVFQARARLPKDFPHCHGHMCSAPVK